MATLRMKIELNKGRKGVLLRKLARINEETEKFLGMLGEDIKISDPREGWLAENFNEGSLDYDIVKHAQNEEGVTNFNEAIDYIIGFDPQKDEFNGVCRIATLRQFANIGNPIDQDESIGFGIYGKQGDQPVKWGELTKIQFQDILSRVEKTREYEGAFRGIIHSLNKGGKRYYFDLRDPTVNYLIKCFFDNKDYPQVIELLKDPNAIIDVAGRIKAKRPDKKIEEITVYKLKPVEKYLDGDLEKFSGCAPDLTGDLSTEEFIEKLRGDDE